jgi:hypothetical protein
MADAHLGGSWDSLLNGVWNPLYPSILANVLCVLRPHPYWESTVVHAVNFFMFCVALVSFEFFLCQLRRSHGKDVLPSWAWTILGYSLFFWSCALAIGTWILSPDLLVASGLFLASGLLVRISVNETGWSTYALLGLVLGLSYLAKSPMLPLGSILIAAAAVLGGRRMLPRVALSAVLFVSIGTLYFVPLSKKLGRLSFGDSGRFNYIAYVGSAGQATQSPSVLFESPLVYGYEAPVAGTFPLHYELTYWVEGLRPRLDLSAQIAALKQNAHICYEIFFSPFHFGLLVTFLTLHIYSGGSVRRLFSYWFLTLPAILALAMFALVHMEPRYVSPSIALLWLGLFSTIKVDSGRLVRSVFGAAVGGVLLAITPATRWQLENLVQQAVHQDWLAAEGLSRLGLVAGDSVAVVYSPQKPHHYYWARLAKVRVLAEVAERDSFWGAEEGTRDQINRVLSEAGIQALVADAANQFHADDAGRGCWKRLDGTMYACMLSE